MSTSGASAAPTVSAFISTALTGSTTEPVISHSTISVSPTSSATASSSREPIAACWSTNSAALPPTAHVEGGGSARSSSHDLLRGRAGRVACRR